MESPTAYSSYFAGTSGNTDSVSSSAAASSEAKPGSAASASDSGVKSSFGSPFSYNPGYNTFFNGKYDPSFQPGNAYNPSLAGYNGNYGFNPYDKFYGYRGTAYPGNSDYPYHHAPAGFSHQFPVDYSKNVPYEPRQPFQFRTGYPTPQGFTNLPSPTLVSASSTASSEVKSNSEQSEVSPSLRQTGTETVQDEGPILKNYQSPLVKPTATSFAKSTQSFNPRTGLLA